MKFLANENFPLTSFHLLRQKSFDVVSVRLEFPGISDEEVMQIARTEQRTILTFDKDYGELVFKHGLPADAGIIFIRW